MPLPPAQPPLSCFQCQLILDLLTLVNCEAECIQHITRLSKWQKGGLLSVHVQPCWQAGLEALSRMVRRIRWRQQDAVSMRLCP